MPKYVKTVSFKSMVVPDPNRDDPVVNSTIQQIVAAGGQVLDVKLEIGGGLSWISTYVVTYEAEEPIVFETPRSVGANWFYVLLVVLLAVAALLGLVLWSVMAAG